MRSTARSRIVIALIFACGCEQAAVPERTTSAPKPGTSSAGPQLVGADPRPEPAVMPASHAPVIGVAVGRYHSCALHADGAVSCWGASADRQLGVADPDLSPVPIGVAVADVVEISADGDATCARQRSGQILCWGGLQNSGIDEAPRATEVGDAVQLSGMCARTSTGDVRCVERGLYAVEVPVHHATSIAARDGVRGCAIGAGGPVTCWRQVLKGEQNALELEPVKVPDPVELAVGSTFACARSAAGRVSCWSFDPEREPGIGKPHALGITDATTLAASATSVCIMRRRHPITCVSPRDGRRVPDELPTLAGRSVTALALAGSHGCVLADGRVACWGDNFDGEVGIGWADTTARAVRVPGLDDVDEVVAAGETTCIRHRDGSVACFGELPQPPAPPKRCTPRRHDLPTPIWCSPPAPTSAVPKHVDAMPTSGPCAISGGVLSCRNAPVAGTHDVIAVTASEVTACALGRDGTTACYHTYDGAPIAMPALDHARAIAVTIQTVGLAHHEPELCALRDDRSVACVTPEATAPVVRATGVISLSSNDKTACVVLGDGRAGCWGLGSYGLLGDGRTRLHDGVAYVRGLTNAVAISVGRIHACARLADGGVACWGYGARGQTGIHVYERVEAATDVVF